MPSARAGDLQGLLTKIEILGKNPRRDVPEWREDGAVFSQKPRQEDEKRCSAPCYRSGRFREVNESKQKST